MRAFAAPASPVAAEESSHRDTAPRRLFSVPMPRAWRPTGDRLPEKVG
ncbi:hypothetical protein [Streptosporangium amethystogenes]|nr:hypothetical protein [Streptosporangium amethystogenes]